MFMDPNNFTVHHQCRKKKYTGKYNFQFLSFLWILGISLFTNSANNIVGQH